MMPMSMRVKARCGFQNTKRISSSSTARASDRPAVSGRGRASRLDDQQQAEQLDRHVQLRMAQDLAPNAAFMKPVSVRSSMTRKARRNSADGHACSRRRIPCRRASGSWRRGRPAADQEKGVVAVAVLAAVADQRPQQHGDDAAEEQRLLLSRNSGRGQLPPKLMPIRSTIQARGQQHQRRAVVAADIDPVLGRSEQEAAEHRPAEAEEHLVGVPLDGVKGAARRRQLTTENQRPEQPAASCRPGRPG
jgi:hypothetical protein